MGQGKDMTNLFIDGFNPFHVRDRFLCLMPVFRLATPQFINECLQLITVSIYIALTSESGE